ncbi:hypothetical protein EPA93_33750 [Ktedonosporobacter rubrisoli]|uniref:PPM-type phosphatase domain-containing protein n=1 Tax=Ktedonosporobacter rubrisoli TaxID=2509675 RepID=A0A4P6JYV6_KTERU|nr:protein phosphatase 2C domain-containing protein [Ktedonosporobacter rubrisoli]QBD80673.1 hypothetical protein EPA93_33750 [Ktedonosporobacter rubrisoli]
MLCPICHTPNRENAKFCKGCGLSFSPESAATPQSEAEATSTEVAKQEETQETPPSPPPLKEAREEDRGEYDVSLAPTQILTPQEMLAYHTRRWQQGGEHENQASDAEKQGQVDIADAPTVLIDPLATEATNSSSVPQVHQEAKPLDITEQPTIMMPLSELGKSVEEKAEQPAEATAPQSSSSPTEEEVSGREADGKESATEESGEEEAEPAPEEAVPSTPEEEDVMEQVTPPTDDQNSQDVPTQPTTPAEDFPVLAPGTLVGARYEIVQVLNDGSEEHAYQVIDHQGYQRCWVCGSQENAEGDEFCIDCGARLRDANYTLHEYPAAEAENQEAHVVQGTIVNTFIEQSHTYLVEQFQESQSAFPNGVHLLAACDSDAGNVRRAEPNEDSTLLLQLERVHESYATPLGVYIVADGMGGHDNGQLASRMAVNAIAKRMVHELLAGPLEAEQEGKPEAEKDEDTLVLLLQGAVEDANTAICQTNQRAKTDMGSTLTGFMIAGDHAYIVNVGDSRTYMLRDEKLYQLTNDHSLVGQLVAGGMIEPDDVYTHPQRSQIYRSLGDKLNVQIDIFKQQIHPGDVLLSCSDGLWEMVRNPQITEILNRAPDPQTACAQLIEAANTNGGEDNVSAVIVFVR